MKTLITLLLSLFLIQSNAQNIGENITQKNGVNNWSKKLNNFKIEPIIGIQFWSTYSMGMTVFNEEFGTYERVDNRINTQIRRTRLGFKGQPYKNLKFNITTSLDLVGKDLLSATQGGGNNGASPSLRIWNAFLQWKVLDKNDGLHFTVGYLSPQIGRESITSALSVTSMEKSWSQNYLRRQLVGTGPGRAVGFNVGGLLLNNENKLGIGYDIGIYNPVNISFSGNSVGEIFSLLTTGRLVFYLGDPESNTYTLSHRINYFSKRKGCSIALSGAYQGETVLFKKHLALGADFLFNWERLNVDGEWTFLTKTGVLPSGSDLAEFNVESNTGHVRISYNIPLVQNRILEPVFMLVQFNGATNSIDQSNAVLVNAFAGKDYSYDLGLNYYFNPKLKLSLHYTFRTAELGDAVAGANFNNYYFQKGVGAIQRGDWVGLGCSAIF